MRHRDDFCVGDTQKRLEAIEFRSAPEGGLEQLYSGIVKHGSVHPIKFQILQIACHRLLTGDYGDLIVKFREFAECGKSW